MAEVETLNVKILELNPKHSQHLMMEKTNLMRTMTVWLVNTYLAANLIGV